MFKKSPGSGLVTANHPSSNSSSRLSRPSASSSSAANQGSNRRPGTPRTLGSKTPDLSSDTTNGKESATSASTPASGLHGIAAAAAAATKSLDKADRQFKTAFCDIPGSTEQIDAHLKTLSTVRCLLQQIRYLDELQIIPVGMALNTLGGLLEKLPDCEFAGLDNAMDEIGNAAKNLEDKLPGHRILLENVRAEDEAVQITGAVAQGVLANSRRVNARFLKVHAGKASIQINGLTEGNLRDVIELAKAMALREKYQE